MPDTDRRTVGKSETVNLPPLTVVVPGQTPQDGTDSPTVRQSDNAKKDKPRAKLAAPLVLLALVAVVAGGVLAVHEWGWWGLAAAAAGLVAVGVLAVSSWRRTARRRRSSSTRRSTSRTGSPGRFGGFGGSRGGLGSGTSGRGRGILGRLTGRSGGTGKGRGGILSRLAGRSGAGTRGRGGLLGGLLGGRSGRGGAKSPGRGAGRRGSILGRGGRGPRMGRGGALLSTGSGSSTGPSTGRRGKKLFRRRKKASATPGFAKGWKRGEHMQAAPSLGIGKAIKKADGAIGKAAGRGWFASAGAVLDAVDTIKPDRITQHYGDNMSSAQRSRFEQIVETLPQTAFTDPILEHDLGVEPMTEGLERSFGSIAQYVDNVTEVMEATGYVGKEPLIQDGYAAIARMVRACGPVADEVHKIVRATPSHQDMEKRMADVNGHKADVETARRMGLI